MSHLKGFCIKISLGTLFFFFSWFSFFFRRTMQALGRSVWKLTTFVLFCNNLGLFSSSLGRSNCRNTFAGSGLNNATCWKGWINFLGALPVKHFVCTRNLATVGQKCLANNLNSAAIWNDEIVNRSSSKVISYIDRSNDIAVNLTLLHCKVLTTLCWLI